MINKLNLTTLNLIILIADSGSMTEAARKADLTLAAVSKRLVELESQLEIPLFTRHGKGVKPTEAGRAVVAQARQLLFDFERLQERLNEYRAGKVGTVRLGANAAAMTQFLPEDLTKFLHTHSDIRVELIELPSDAIVDRLSDGRLDLGVFAERQTPTPIRTFPYRTHRLCVIVSPKSEFAQRESVSFEEVAVSPIIGLEGGSTIIRLLQRQASKNLNIPIQVRSFDVVCRFVQAGLGIGIIPERTASMYCAAMGLKWIPLTDDWAQRETLIGARSFDTLTPSAQLLFDELRQQPDSTSTRS